MPIGVRADRAHPERASQPLRLGVFLLGVGACTQLAGSPIEVGPRVDLQADAGVDACLARDSPIVFEASGASSELEVQLYLISASGTGVQRIARGAAYYAPVWAPDGRSIAFRRRSSTAIGAGAISELGIMAPDGTEQVVLFADRTPASLPAGSFGPTWAPDGQSIAFASPRNTIGAGLWVMSRFGGDPRPLLPDLASWQSDPNWSRHDPDRIACVITDGDDADIWQVSVSDPADRQNLTQGRALHPRVPRWSPDGERLAFAAEDPLPQALGGGDEEVYVWTAATSDIVQITDNEYLDMNPVWSPDGKSLLVRSNRLPDGAPPSAKQRNGLWFVPLDSSEPPHPLDGTPGEVTGVDWDWSSCGAAP